MEIKLFFVKRIFITLKQYVEIQCLETKTELTRKLT